MLASLVDAAVVTTHPSTPIEDSEEGRAFLQARMAIFGFMGGAISLGFLVFRALTALTQGVFVKEVWSASFLFHGLAGLSLLALWPVCRTGRRTPEFVRRAEFAALAGASFGYAMMGYYMPLLGSPDMIVYMAATLGLFARAVYIPSTAKRTALVCIDVSIPPVVVGYIHSTQMDQVTRDAIEAVWSGNADNAPLMGLVFMLAWWSCTAVTCAAASRVVYGLRRQVRDSRKLGQYTLEDKLGEGGMGVVYRASHAMLRRPTAIKLVPPEKAGERALARFEREVQLTAILSHPNTVTVFDYGRTPDGIFYYAMEYLDGPTLARVVEETGAMPAARVVHVLGQAAGALAEAHQIGLIHRDIKPANMMLVDQGGIPDTLKVLDFGLVKELNTDPGASLTRAEVITGTPQYMSPEAIRDPGKVDARSDLYALAAVGYYLITGTHLFTGSSVVEVCSEHLHTPPEPPSQRLGAPVDPALEQLLLDCLAKQPNDRPAGATELRERLRELTVEPWTERQARDWWVGPGRALLVAPHEPHQATDATIDVDFAHRDTPAPSPERRAAT